MTIPPERIAELRKQADAILLIGYETDMRTLVDVLFGELADATARAEKAEAIVAKHCPAIAARDAAKGAT